MSDPTIEPARVKRERAVSYLVLALGSLVGAVAGARSWLHSGNGEMVMLTVVIPLIGFVLCAIYGGILWIQATRMRDVLISPTTKVRDSTPFRFAFDNVLYVGPEDMVWARTILVGHIESGTMQSGDVAMIPIASGGTFRGKMVGFDLNNRIINELSAGDPTSQVAVCIYGQPEHKDILVPGVANLAS